MRVSYALENCWLFIRTKLAFQVISWKEAIYALIESEVKLGVAPKPSTFKAKAGESQGQPEPYLKTLS